MSSKELLYELAVLEALLVDSTRIDQISDEALEGWICYMRDALESEASNSLGTGRKHRGESISDTSTTKVS
jgi:hypothetical protein